jgi:hypothetical protein
MPRRPAKTNSSPAPIERYDAFLVGVVGLLEEARRTSARAVNAVITTTYWQVGRRIVEAEQRGARKAAYGAKLIERLAEDLTGRFGRGFSKRNLEQMRAFYLGWSIAQTPSAQFQAPALPVPAAPGSARRRVASAESCSAPFPLSWSHYVRLLSVGNPAARAFYEAGGSVVD